MGGIDVFHVVLAVIFLLMTATFSAVLLKKLHLPYTIGLVGIGILLAMFFSHFPEFSGMQKLRLNFDLIMYVFLPALIFDAAVNIDTRLLRKNLWPTLTLAAPGLVISTLIVGVIVHFCTPLGWGGAMLFGALISATDPVAVISLFEEVGAPKRLRILVDGESLFNDATAIVMFNIVKVMVLGSVAFSLETAISGTLEFLWVFFGGLALGILIGAIMTWLIIFVDDNPLLEVSMSTIVAYLAFIIADRSGVSGVMSVLGAGIVIAHYGKSKFTPEVKSYMSEYWAFMSFLANSFIFLLLGFTEEFILFASEIPRIGMIIFWTILAVLVSRMVVVFGLCPVLGYGKHSEKISLPYQIVMFWGGLRGAVPLALVFSLPPELPGRNLIVEITLAVVLFTLLVQGTTIRALLGFFSLDKPDKFFSFSQMYALYRARTKGLEVLDRYQEVLKISDSISDRLKGEFQEKITLENQKLEEFSATNSDSDKLIRQIVFGRAIASVIELLEKLYHNALIPEKVFRRLNDKYHVLAVSVIDDGILPVFSPRRSPLSSWYRYYVKLLKCLRWRRRDSMEAYERSLYIEYYYKLATKILCLEAIKSMDNMHEVFLFKDFHSAVAEVKDYFGLEYNAAEEALARIKNNSKIEILENFEEITLVNAIMGAELNTINEMIEHGEIPEEAGAELLRSIRIRLKQLHAHSQGGIDSAWVEV